MAEIRLEDRKIAVWFSCGATSAVAAKLAVEQYGKDNVRVVNNPIFEEDVDNIRFLKDVEVWLGVKIESSKNLAFPDHSAQTVWKKRKYMSNANGHAPCTEELKREARRHWEDLNGFNGRYVFGFPVGEEGRHKRLVESGMDVLPVLIDAGYSKQRCFEYLMDSGISLPRVYTMASRFGSGFPNANCIGCVKATSPTYWNHVRETFPDVFDDRARLSREIGARLVRHKGQRIFLDELPVDARGRSMKTMNTECSIICGESTSSAK